MRYWFKKLFTFHTVSFVIPWNRRWYPFLSTTVFPSPKNLSIAVKEETKKDDHEFIGCPKQIVTLVTLSFELYLLIYNNRIPKGTLVKRLKWYQFTINSRYNFRFENLNQMLCTWNGVLRSVSLWQQTGQTLCYTVTLQLLCWKMVFLIQFPIFYFLFFVFVNFVIN